MTHQKLYLTKRSNQFYYIGWIEDGKRRWKSTKCTVKSDALQYLKEFRTSDTKPPSIFTLSELFRLFQEEHGPSIRPGTIRTYDWSVKAIVSICGDKNLPSYNISDIEQFKKERSAQKSSPTTINMYLRNLMAVFSFAVKRGLLNHNPIHCSNLIKIPKLPPVYLSRDDFPKLISQTKNPTLRDIFTFTAFTGLRLGEILNLQYSHCDLQRRQFSVVNTDTFLTKSGKNRVIPLNDIAFEILQRRLNQHHVGQYVFGKNGYRYDRHYVSHAFKKSVRKAELSTQLHFHSLRHTFGSWCAQRNIPIYTIQALMGHSDVQTTAIYAHLSESHLHSAVSKL